jgi:hypothetical protein
LCNDFTIEGKIPEPLRVARLCARKLIPVKVNVYNILPGNDNS